MASVEISVDGGHTWRQTVGRGKWEYVHMVHSFFIIFFFMVNFSFLFRSLKSFLVLLISILTIIEFEIFNFTNFLIFVIRFALKNSYQVFLSTFFIYLSPFLSLFFQITSSTLRPVTLKIYYYVPY